jgi:SAM-dependent methyltransferase
MGKELDSASEARNSSEPADGLCPMCRTAGHAVLTTKMFRGKEYSLALCRHCGQHYCLPIPSLAEIASFYAGDYHESARTPGGSEQQFGAKFRRYRDWILQFIRSGRTLDIGTSTGLFPSLLKTAGFDAEGLEFNPASAAWGQANYGVRIRTCALEETGEAPSSFDLISMTDVLEHTQSPLNYLGVVRSYLKPGGYMLITFPDICSPESRYLRFLAGALRRDWIWSTCHIPLHVWEFTPATALAMFRKAGFEVMGFHRSHEADPDAADSTTLAMLRFPLRLLDVPALGRAAGTQMEFIIRRRD